MTVITLALCAAFFHALWNTLIKRAADRIGAMTAMTITEIAIAGVLAFVVAPLPVSAWPILVLGVIFHTCYRLCLLLAYHLGDFSQVYPLARGSAPLIATVFAYLFLGEELSIQKIIGILLICVSVVSLSLGGKGHKQVAAALLVSVCIASYTVIDAAGARIGESPLPYIVWINLMESLSYLTVVSLRRKGATLNIERQSWRYGITAGVLGITAYGMIIYALTLSQVGEVSALREISVIFGVLFGVYWLKEKQHTRRRIFSAAIVVVGISFLVN